MGTIKEIRHDLQLHVNPEKAAFFPRFFKTGKGEYGEGDRFMGIVVPDQRAIAKKHFASTDADTIKVLLDGKFHEERLTGLFILCLKFNQSKKIGDEKQWFDLYNEKIERVNNWDLVDSSAHIIIGQYLEKRDRKLLYTFAKSKSLWKNRIAVISTFHFIRKNDFKDILELAGMMLQHPHDLMHKAIGWMLREAWKRDPLAIEEFLDEHATVMPRTMLRYAIEKMDEKKRKGYLNQ